MKQHSNNRRSRSRGGKQRHGGGRNNYESNGPEVKVRGTAQQVLDKYLALARDAASAGDRVNAESYYQHAEHYYRVLNADQANNPNRRDNRQGQNQTPAEKPEVPAEQPAVEAEAEVATETAEVEAPNVPLADQPQPEIAGLPPAIPETPATASKDGDGEEAAPKPRRRRSRAKSEPKAEEAEAAQA